MGKEFLFVQFLIQGAYWISVAVITHHNGSDKPDQTCTT